MNCEISASIMILSNIFVSQLIWLLSLVSYLKAANDTEECFPIGASCVNEESCCTQLCLANSCSDGLHRNSRDRSGGPTDISQLIAMELASGNNVDVSDHEHIDLLPSFDECGKSSVKRRKKRIVGGTPYELGKYPWAVALHINEITDEISNLQCGGSLIGRRHVITAAHCITRLPAGSMLKWVTLGNVDRSLKVKCENETSGECKMKDYVDAEVESFIIHEDYSEAHVRNDIALIVLKEEVNFTENIQPICLPISERYFNNWPDGQMTVIGWGSQNDANDQGPQLISFKAQEVDIRLVHRSICNRFFTRTIGVLRKSQICAGGNPSQGDCAGDSGGSLFKRISIPTHEDENSKKRYFLVGLVSTGAITKCARQGKPSVFTNVIYYMPWILENMAKNEGELYLHEHRVNVDPVQEFNTGFDPPIHLHSHENINILPKNCGITSWEHYHSGPAATQSVPHKRVKRITGGFIQGIGTFPWMAQIYARHIVTTEPAFRCGGVLISSRHVLTAAHCVADIRGSFVLEGIVLGNFNRKAKVECLGTDCMEQNIIPIEEVAVHEEFTKFARENDVALIKLAHDVSFNSTLKSFTNSVVFTGFVQPICLPLSEDIVRKAWKNPTTDRKYASAGWGRVTSNSEETVLSNILVAANFTIESKSYCESVLTRKIGRLENSRVCGSGLFPGRGECIGDTGGPMMRWVTETSSGTNLTKMFVFGILSVVECAEHGIPSIYQNVLYYMPWIMEHLNF